MIAVSELRCKVGRRESRAISFSVDEPGFYVLTGRNGAGKSTLLAVLSGRLRPTSGEIRVEGEVISVARATHRVVVADTEIPGMSKRSFADWARARSPLWGVTPESLQRSVERWMVGSYVHSRFSHLSSGMRARCVLAFAFASSAPLICLDEPERSLDSEAQAILASTLSTRARAGGTVLVATDNPLTLSLADGAIAVDWLDRR